MAAPYAAMVRAAVAHDTGGRRDGDAEAQDRQLDRLARLKGLDTRYADLAARARSVKSADELLQLAQALHRWRLEMTHDAR
jgi:hypothetical protein